MRSASSAGDRALELPEHNPAKDCAIKPRRERPISGAGKNECSKLSHVKVAPEREARLIIEVGRQLIRREDNLRQEGPLPPHRSARAGSQYTGDFVSGQIFVRSRPRESKGSVRH